MKSELIKAPESDCCKAAMRVVGTETKHYRCNHCGMPCDQAQEETKPTHQDDDKRGILEGLKLAREEVIKGLFTEPVCISDVVKAIDELIEQHSGE